MREQLQTDILYLSSTEPFFMIFLMNIVPKYDTKIESYVIKLKKTHIDLKLNREWYESHSLKIRLNILRQALLHVIMMHWYYDTDYKDEEQLKKFLIACEMEANCYIDFVDGNIIDKETDITVEKMNEVMKLNLEKKKDFKYYYDNLEGQDLSQFPTPNGGEGYQEGMDDSIEKELQVANLKGNLEQAKSNLKAGDHLDDYIQSFLDRFQIQPAKVDWRRILRNFLTSHGKKIQADVSRKSINKVFPGRPGQIHNYVGSVLVAIDTSGSISEQEYVDFMNEIHHISRKYTVNLVHCDSDIRYGPHKFSKQNADQYAIHGGGGTRFNPVLEMYNKSDDTVCIYFTDSYNFDELIQPKKPIIWINTSNSDAQHLKQLNNSTVIKLNNN